jgi:hypothetical protein
MPQGFDSTTLVKLRQQQEIRIRAGRSASGVIIWVVVVDGTVFIRSFRGAGAKWYLAATGDGRAALEVDGAAVPVKVTPAADQATIEAVSRAFLSKYAASPYAQAMVRPEVLPTTLRVEPLG